MRSYCNLAVELYLVKLILFKLKHLKKKSLACDKLLGGGPMWGRRRKGSYEYFTACC